MRRKQSKTGYPWLILAIFGAGLLLGGVLLYRWIDRVSVADREQQVEFLQAAMRSFRGEIAGTLLEIRSTFRPIPHRGSDAGLENYLAEFYSQWRANDPNGALVSSFSVAVPEGGKLLFRTLNAKTGKFETQPWPASLQSFRERSIRVRGGPARGRGMTVVSGGIHFALEGERPVVVVPLVESGLQNSGAGPETAIPAPDVPEFFLQGEDSGPAPPPLIRKGGRLPIIYRKLSGRITGWCFLGLDVEYLRKQSLPSLLERTFSGPGLANYHVAILAGEPPKVVFSSAPGLTPDALSPPDGQLALFNSGGQFRARFFGLLRPHPGRHLRPDRLFFGAAPGPPFPPPNFSPEESAGGPPIERGGWRLVAKSKAGSIDALVARSRRRNLALGYGVLLLLACSMGALVFATRRARELARREMEFVAGISHELRTPLAAIHSAGFNLASGVVRKPNRVQEYGSLVQQEARRLTDMVDQVLSYAGIQSGERHYELVPTSVPEVIERALNEYTPVLRASGWEVEKDLPEDLPLVLADPPSLESGLKNLIGNALKYAERGKWMRISARAAGSAANPEVEISVADRGPGIAPNDLPHVFEPFYRGKKVLASSVPGAGLGLSILRRHVEAHGGRVSVKSIEGQGSEFALHLPAVPAVESEAV